VYWFLSQNLHIFNQFTEGANPQTNGDTIFNFYVDGESTPSISYTLDMLAGIGFDDNQAPWVKNVSTKFNVQGNDHFGKGAATGGVYSTIRIPFTTRFFILYEFNLN
jgi:hypothetical protein